MGTPDFACPTLQKIIDNNHHQIIAVYTKEPSIAKRGHQLQNSQIHNLALKHNLKVFTPKNFKDPQNIEQFTNLQADIAVVVAYGLILKQDILQSPKFGCINIHPSLLPRWRGASPIQRTIMAGDNKTAVDIIQMDSQLDTGNILLRKEISLNGQETYSSLAFDLANIGADLTIQALDIFEKNNFDKFLNIKQDDTKACYATKISKEECLLDFNQSCQIVLRKIKGLSGSLDAYFIHNNEKIKILDAQIIDDNSCDHQPSKIINDQFYIQCLKGIIQPLIVQRQGKKAMSISEFLLGFKFSN